MHIELGLQGLHCASCVERVEGALRNTEGVREAAVQLASQAASLDVDDRFNPSDAVKSVEQAGYRVRGSLLRIGITGMPDAAAADSLRASLAARRGVLEAHVSFASSEAEVEYVPDLVPPQALVDHVRHEGYAAQARAESDAARPESFVPAGASIAGAAAVMALSMAHLPDEWHLRSAVAQAVITLVILAVPGRRFFVGFWRSIRRRVPDMDTLVALGTAASFGASVAVLPHGPLYFDSAAAIVAILLLGRTLEARARARMGEAVAGLTRLAPERAVRVEDGREVEVRASELRGGDGILIRAGERVPADGFVVEGASAVDESLLTGEPMPVEKGEGDTVTGGTVNRHGMLRVRVTRSGADTVLAGIARRVRDAQASKAPVQRLADRICAWFVPLVIAAAGASWALTDWQAAVTVLVVACPCSLGLAVPVATITALGRAGMEGVLIKDAETLQRLARVRAIVLDKTGTVTRGRPEVADVATAQGWTRERVLAIAAAVEAGSTHPLAEAIRREAPMQRPESGEFEEKPGFGARAAVDGHVAIVGRAGLLREAGIEPLAREGPGSEVHVAHGERAIGVIWLADALRAEAGEAVSDLRGLGLSLSLVSGDGRAAVEAAAGALGMDDWHAEVAPAEKAALVEKRRPAAFVGDGINDAPALAAADVGIALATGSDIAAAAGSVVLTRPDLRRVGAAIRLARRATAVMKQNLAWAFGYNAILIPVAAGAVPGLRITPMIAAAAMAASSITVVLNALRLRR